MHEFSGPLGLKRGFWGRKIGDSGAKFLLLGFLCQSWWKSIKNWVRESAHTRTDRQTHRRKPQISSIKHRLVDSSTMYERATNHLLHGSGSTELTATGFVCGNQNFRRPSPQNHMTLTFNLRGAKRVTHTHTNTERQGSVGSKDRNKMQTRSHPQRWSVICRDSRVTLNFDLSEIPFVRFYSQRQDLYSHQKLNM